MIAIKRACGQLAQEDGCRVLVDRLWSRGLARENRLTLVYAAADWEHNNAIVLREALEEQLGR